MAKSITFSPFIGYGLTYELLEQFCALFSKTHHRRSHLLGPICVIRGDELAKEEMSWLQHHPEVTTYGQCVLISFEGKGSEDERRLQTSNIPWCTNDEEGFAYVVLPEILAFLTCHSFE